MPRGVYSRKKSKEIGKEVSKLKSKRKFPTKRMLVVIFSLGNKLEILRDEFHIRNFSELMHILYTTYDGIPIKEIRVNV